MLLLFDLGIILLVATVLAFFAKFLKQPLVLSYVVAGILIGPNVLRLITNAEIMTILAELGIAFLLFIVGLELDIKRLRDVGKVSVGCGLGQIIVTFIFGFGLATLLGFSKIESTYLSFAFTISSTMIVVKLLSDKKELETLHGKIVLGTLLVQDIASILFLAMLPTIYNFSFSIATASLITGLGLISIALFSSRYILPPLVRYAAKSTELLFLFALSWCFLFSLFSYSVFRYLLGFDVPPFAIGAFLAGVSLASFPYNFEIVSRVKSLKDFFATIFFVSLGMQVPIEVGLISEVIIFSLFVLVGGAVIMFVITNLYGYGKRISFLTAIYLAQISEFSLIIGTQGVLLGHITMRIFSLIAWVALITITISSYFIIHSSQMYKLFLPVLRLFDNVSRRRKFENIPPTSKDHVVVCGCDRTGYDIMKTLKVLKKNFIVVDYNPEVIKNLMSQNVKCIYGDVEDFEILERIDLKNAHVVISTIPNHSDNVILLNKTREINPSACVILRAESLDDAIDLYKKRANYVLFPELLGGEKISEFLNKYYQNRYLCLESKQKEMEKLERIKEEEVILRYDPSLLKHWKKGLKS